MTFHSNLSPRAVTKAGSKQAVATTRRLQEIFSIFPWCSGGWTHNWMLTTSVQSQCHNMTVTDMRSSLSQKSINIGFSVMVNTSHFAQIRPKVEQGRGKCGTNECWKHDGSLGKGGGEDEGAKMSQEKMQ